MTTLRKMLLLLVLAFAACERSPRPTVRFCICGDAPAVTSNLLNVPDKPCTKRLCWDAEIESDGEQGT